MPWRPGSGWWDRNALGERHSALMCCARRLTFRRHGRPRQGCNLPCHTTTVLWCHTPRWVVVTGVTRVSWEWVWYLWLAKQRRQGICIRTHSVPPQVRHCRACAHSRSAGYVESACVVGASSCCCTVRSQSQADLQTPCVTPPWCHRHCLACATETFWKWLLACGGLHP
jgi:hypothetical protein